MDSYEISRQIGETVRQAMDSVNLTPTHFKGLHEYLLFGSPSSTYLYVTNFRNGEPWAIPLSVAMHTESAKRHLTRLARFLYLLPIDETDPIVDLIRQNYPEFVFPPAFDGEESQQPTLEQKLTSLPENQRAFVDKVVSALYQNNRRPKN